MAAEQVGDRGVEAVALGVGIGGAGAAGSPSSGSSRASSPPELRSAAPGQRVERLDERPVRRVHDGVAGAVEHERARGGRGDRELAHEPALARAGLAADEHHPAALALGPRDQRAEGHQLALTADERERGGEAQRSRELAQ